MTEWSIGIDAASLEPGHRVARRPVSSYRDLEPHAAREHARWRQLLLAELARESARSDQAWAHDLDHLCGQLLRVAHAVGTAYGTPDLGNKPDPVDELVYIILSRRTREGAYQAAYAA